jgi:selenocysteine lyase/cysteine desulfurase
VFTDKPVVFLSVFEHNCNLLAWRETGAIVELINFAEDGSFDYE